MNVFSRDQLMRWSLAAVVLGAAVFVCDRSLAQDSTAGDSARAGESVKVEPYTGPPIYLDEQEQVAAPAMIRRDNVREPAEGQGPVRVERQVAVYSDNNLEADGYYREYYPNGNLFAEGQYAKGRQTGEWTFYYDNGQVNRKATYKDGQPDGTRQIFRADGTLSARRTYLNGDRDGEWVSFDATGENKLTEEHYDKGKQDGEWKAWHPNGQLKTQIGFKKGVRDGLSAEWDDKGQPRFEARYVDGKLHGTLTRWYPDGRKIVYEYEQGKLKSQTN